MCAVSSLAVSSAHDIEAAHVRHHQVEHDHVRQLAPCDVDRLAPPYAAAPCSASRHARARSARPQRRVIIDHQDLERLARHERQHADVRERVDSSCREIGFCMTAAAPSEKPFVGSATIEMITTGMRCRSGIA
jgi:hypothetical protein